MEHHCIFCNTLCEIFFENNLQTVYICPNCNMKLIVYKVGVINYEI